MTGDYRYHDPLPSWRTAQVMRAYRRRRRDFYISAFVWAAFGFLCAWLVFGCASPPTVECEYDPGCWETVGFTDSDVGCINDCLAPEKE